MHFVEPVRFRIRVDDQPRPVLPVSVRKVRQHRDDDGLEPDSRPVAVGAVAGSVAAQPDVRPRDASPSLRHRERSSERLQSFFLVIASRVTNRRVHHDDVTVTLNTASNGISIIRLAKLKYYFSQFLFL